MAITAQKLFPQSKSGATTPTPIRKNAITRITPIATKKPAADEGEDKDTLVVIKERCIEIDTLLKGSLTLDKIRAEEARKKKQTQRRAANEARLESKDKGKEERGFGLKLPRMGFFDRIKEFIKNVLLGFILTRLIKFAPLLQRIVPFLSGAIDFMTDFVTGLVDGLGTFLKWGFDAYEKTEEFIDNIGGEDAVGAFNKFTGALEKFLSLALIAGLATGALEVEKNKGGRGGRGGRGGLGGRGGRPGAIRRFTKKYGRDAAIKRFGKEAVRKFGGSAGRSAATNLARRGLVGALGKGGTRAGLRFVKKFISPIVKRIPILGGLIDFALNYFVFKEPIGRAAFAAIGATILGVIGTGFGGPLGAIIGGFVGDAAGKKLYDIFFSGKKPVEIEDDQKDQKQDKSVKSTTSYSQGKQGKFDIKSSNNIVNIGKNLVSKGFSVAEHPDFTKTPTASGGTYTPGEGSVSNVHSGDGHYESRAIDVTDWRGTLEDSKARYRSVLDSIYNNGNMANDMLLIHDSWGVADKSGKNPPGRHGHPTHMHIEVKDKGGFIGKGLFQNKGGMEFVLDHDTTKAVEETFPGFLNTFNKAEGKDAVDVLKQYASYDMPEMIPVPIPVPIQNATGNMYEKGKSASVNIVVKGKESFNDILYMR